MTFLALMMFSGVAPAVNFPTNSEMQPKIILVLCYRGDWRFSLESFSMASNLNSLWSSGKSCTKRLRTMKHGHSGWLERRLFSPLSVFCCWNAWNQFVISKQILTTKLQLRLQKQRANVIHDPNVLLDCRKMHKLHTAWSTVPMCPCSFMEVLVLLLQILLDAGVYHFPVQPYSLDIPQTEHSCTPLKSIILKSETSAGYLQHFLLRKLSPIPGKVPEADDFKRGPKADRPFRTPNATWLASLSPPHNKRKDHLVDNK